MTSVPRRPDDAEALVTDRAREVRIARLLALLISATLVGLGGMTIVTGHYYGRTSKLGGAEVSFDGPAAIGMGVSTVLFGLFPLALLFGAKRSRMLWTVGCLVAAGLAFFASLYLRRV